MDFLLGLASFLLVLIPLVIIHEFGHFIAAKLSGITVLEFGIGFPPRAKILFRKGDTIYTLNWLPIGGFVRPYGEDFVRPKTEEEMTADRREIVERGIKNPKSVFEANPWQRIFFMAAGPGINFLAALILFILVALVGQPFARADVTVYDVVPGSPAAQADLQSGDVILALDGEKIESADEFNDRINDQVNDQVTLLVERDGEQIEVPLTASVVDESEVERAYITGLFEDSPAVEAGLQVEDVIIAVDGIEITSVGQLQKYTSEREGVEIQVTVLRNGEELTIPVTPRERDGEVLMGIQITGVKPAIIGLTAVNRDTETYTRALPVGEAIETGFTQFVNAHRLLIEFVGDLVSGDIAPSAARPVSPVGIGQLGGPVLEQSLEEEEMYPIVLFAAMISIALAITNLLPIPGLDGGRILLVVVELIRGKPMEPEREGLIHFIGLLFLLALIAFTVINDIVNPIDINNLR
jgi:regulator of sigma E protease